MEGGGNSNSQHRNIMRTSNYIDTNETVSNEVSNLNPQQTIRLNSNQHVPIANVTKIMRRILPPHTKISEDAKETIQECVSEFISFITNEANEKCHQESRKTITAEDILSAMGTLGFDNYIEPLTTFLNKYRAQDHPKRNIMHHMSFSRNNDSFVQQSSHIQTVPYPTQQVPLMIQGYAPPLPRTYPMHRGHYVELPQYIDNYLVGNQGGEEVGSLTRMEYNMSKELIKKE